MARTTKPSQPLPEPSPETNLNLDSPLSSKPDSEVRNENPVEIPTEELAEKTQENVEDQDRELSFHPSHMKDGMKIYEEKPQEIQDHLVLDQNVRRFGKEDPVFCTAILKGYGVTVCDVCGDQLHSDFDGSLICSVGKSKSECGLLKDR